MQERNNLAILDSETKLRPQQEDELYKCVRQLFSELKPNIVIRDDGSIGNEHLTLPSNLDTLEAFTKSFAQHAADPQTGERLAIEIGELRSHASEEPQSMLLTPLYRHTFLSIARWIQTELSKSYTLEWVNAMVESYLGKHSA